MLALLLASQKYMPTRSRDSRITLKASFRFPPSISPPAPKPFSFQSCHRIYQEDLIEFLKRSQAMIILARLIGVLIKKFAEEVHIIGTAQ